MERLNDGHNSWMTDVIPGVLVVVPTTGRPELTFAVESALAQTQPPSRVVVVVDGGNASQVRRSLPNDGCIEVLATDPLSTGGNAARMLGVRSGMEPVVAFLDDDDVWHPGKLRVQLRLLDAMPGSRRVVSCRFELLTPDGLATGVQYPRRLLRPEENVAEYLFRRREVRYGEALLHTSTLLCDRQVVDTTPWKEGLVRHQDWDWVLSAAQVPGTRFAMTGDILTGVRASQRSLSAAGSWFASAAWVESRYDCLDARQRSDFLLAHTVPLALRTEGHLAALHVVMKALRAGRPGRAALLACLGSLIAPARLREPSVRSPSPGGSFGPDVGAPE